MEDEVSLLDVLPPSPSKCLHDPARPVLALRNLWFGLFPWVERPVDVEGLWPSKSQELQDRCGENSHLAPVYLEDSVSGLRLPPTGFHGAPTVNTDSRSRGMNAHTADKAVDLDVV